MASPESVDRDPYESEHCGHWLGLLILIAAGCLVAGWLLPIMTVHSFFLLSDEVSILSSLLRLWQAEHYGLLLLVATFTLVFPGGKLAVSFYLWIGLLKGRRFQRHRMLTWLDHLGRWSMLDVFVVALIVVAVEISIISDVEVHAGIYVFSVGVLLSIAAVHLLKRVLGRA